MSTEVERARGLRARRHPDRSRALESVRRPRSTRRRSAARKGRSPPSGPLACRTGQHTGRSPNDKFIVREPSSEAEIAWGKVNRPLEPAQFDALHQRHAGARSAGKELFVLDCFAGADPAYRLPVRVITEYAWHNLFCPQPVHRRPGAARWRAGAAVHRHRRAELQGRSRRGTARSSEVVDRAQLRRAAGADRRHAATPARSRSRSSRC